MYVKNNVKKYLLCSIVPFTLTSHNMIHLLGLRCLLEYI